MWTRNGRSGGLDTPSPRGSGYSTNDRRRRGRPPRPTVDDNANPTSAVLPRRCRYGTPPPTDRSRWTVPCTTARGLDTSSPRGSDYSTNDRTGGLLDQRQD